MCTCFVVVGLKGHNTVGDLALFLSLSNKLSCLCFVVNSVGIICPIYGNIKYGLTGCLLSNNAAAVETDTWEAAQHITKLNTVNSVMDSFTELQIAQNGVVLGVTVVDKGIGNRVIVVEIYTGIFFKLLPLLIEQIKTVELTCLEQLKSGVGVGNNIILDLAKLDILSLDIIGVADHSDLSVGDPLGKDIFSGACPGFKACAVIAPASVVTHTCFVQRLINHVQTGMMAHKVHNCILSCGSNCGDLNCEIVDLLDTYIFPSNLDTCHILLLIFISIDNTQIVTVGDHGCVDIQQIGVDTHLEGVHNCICVHLSILACGGTVICPIIILTNGNTPNLALFVHLNGLFSCKLTILYITVTSLIDEALVKNGLQGLCNLESIVLNYNIKCRNRCIDVVAVSAVGGIRLFCAAAACKSCNQHNSRQNKRQPFFHNLSSCFFYNIQTIPAYYKNYNCSFSIA